MLTPGHTSDIKAAELLKEHVTGFRRLVADRGYDANWFRGFLKQAGHPQEPSDFCRSDGFGAMSA